MWKWFYKDSKISGIAVSKSKPEVWVFRVMKDSEWWGKVYDPFHIWETRYGFAMSASCSHESWTNVSRMDTFLQLGHWGCLCHQTLLVGSGIPVAIVGSPWFRWKVEMEKSWGSCSCRCQGMMLTMLVLLGDSDVVFSHVFSGDVHMLLERFSIRRAWMVLKKRNRFI